jgi:hypothetical protein
VAAAPPQALLVRFRAPVRRVLRPRMMGPMTFSADAITSYVDRAVQAMSEILAELGDDLANQRPDLPGANSPYVILRHCLGVMEFWGGHAVAGREIHRDRPAEFRAAGPVADLVKAASEACHRFGADAATAEPEARPRGSHHSMASDELEVLSQEHALLHVVEEVCQHLGQLEITRDLLRHRDQRA